MHAQVGADCADIRYRRFLSAALKPDSMFKFAFALGIVAEWVTGPVIASAPAFGLAASRAFIATLVAWMILEGLRTLVRAVQTLDDRA